jgi:hypothetical protein
MFKIVKIIQNLMAKKSEKKTGKHTMAINSKGLDFESRFINRTRFYTNQDAEATKQD